VTGTKIGELKSQPSWGPKIVGAALNKMVLKSDVET